MKRPLVDRISYELFKNAPVTKFLNLLNNIFCHGRVPDTLPFLLPFHSIRRKILSWSEIKGETFLWFQSLNYLQDFCLNGEKGGKTIVFKRISDRLLEGF